MTTTPRMNVYTPLEREAGHTFWVRVGSAFVNRDGSINVYLDALPVNGKLQIREPNDRAEVETPVGDKQ